MLEDFVPLVVQIAGQEYTLRVPPSKIDQAKQLVQFVNQKMHEIGQKSGTVTTSRVAVLTALAIADELFTLQEKTGLPLLEKPKSEPTHRPTATAKPAKETKEIIKEIKDKKEPSPEVQKKVAILSSLIDEELSKS